MSRPLSTAAPDNGRGATIPAARPGIGEVGPDRARASSPAAAVGTRDGLYREARIDRAGIVKWLRENHRAQEANLIERFGEAVFTAQKCKSCFGRGTLNCDDSQCGDSTWDHYCNEGRKCDPCDGLGAVVSAPQQPAPVPERRAAREVAHGFCCAWGQLCWGDVDGDHSLPCDYLTGAIEADRRGGT